MEVAGEAGKARHLPFMVVLPLRLGTGDLEMRTDAHCNGVSAEKLLSGLHSKSEVHLGGLREKRLSGLPNFLQSRQDITGVKEKKKLGGGISS